MGEQSTYPNRAADNRLPPKVMAAIGGEMIEINDIKQGTAIPLRRLGPIIGLLIAGVAASITLFVLVHRWEQTNLRNEFESWARAHANAVETTLTSYVGALRFMGDFFDNSPGVTRQQFAALVQSILPRYPGIQAFSWNPLVQADERDLFEAAVRQEGFAGFEFTERSGNHKLVRAEARQEYVVVYYIHPLETNRSALGFDIASNPTRQKAIQKGFATGELAATGRITLVQETGDQFGLLLLLPVYHQGGLLNGPEERRQRRKGFVVEVLRIGQAVETALQGFSDEGLSLSLYDMSADEENRFLYHRPSARSPVTERPIAPGENQQGLVWGQTFDFAGRQWRIMFRPSEVYYQTRKMWQAWMVLAGSLLLTILVTFYMRHKVRYTGEIEQRVVIQAQTNRQLEKEISERIAAEAQRDETILNLQQALKEVKTLRGILPICSYCKKVRDDKGYWERVDVYIHKHSQADISHGICPDCQKQYYPEYHARKHPPDNE